LGNLNPLEYFLNPLREKKKNSIQPKLAIQFQDLHVNFSQGIKSLSTKAVNNRETCQVVLIIKD